MACTKEAEIDMLTWNVGGSKSEKNFTNLRNIIVSHVNSVLNDCICFWQEIPNSETALGWGVKNFAPKNQRGKIQAGVSVPNQVKEKLLLQKVEINSDELKLLKVAEEYAERLYGTKVLISTGAPKNGCPYVHCSEITLLSYHAKYKSEDKKLKMIEFIDNMLRLAVQLSQTIIVGGDFNYPVLNIHDYSKQLALPTPNHYDVLVALYVASPRRWESCIDTFIIVHPSCPDLRTECQFSTTVPIYPFPMIRPHSITIGSGELLAYPPQPAPLPNEPNPPPPAHVWFKFVDYHEDEGRKIIDVLQDKVATISAKLEELKNEGNEEKVKLLSEKLEESKKSLLQPYQGIVDKLSCQLQVPPPAPPPAPLWPHSPLHKVLDHDPVLTTVKITLKPKPVDDVIRLTSRFEQLRTSC